MINSINCKYCNAQNPFYNLNCSQCKAYLRDRVPNIDIGKTILNILISPKETLLQIIYAEKKNYSIVLNFLLSLVFFILNLILANLYIKPNDKFATNFVSFNLSFLFLCVFMGYNLAILFNFILLKLTQKIITCYLDFKNYWAVVNYAMIPMILWFFFIFPVALATLGDTIFVWYPAPYIYKPFVFYTLSILSVLILVYSIILLSYGIGILLHNRIIGFLISFVHHILIVLMSNLIVIGVVNFYRH